MTATDTGLDAAAEDVETFLRALAEDNQRFYDETPEELRSYWPSDLSPAAAVEALRVRWFNEYIGTIVLARLVDRVEDATLKMLIARQVGDEAKHANVCARRIRELGSRVDDYVPPPEQLVMYDVLDGYTYPEQFLAAMQFTTEHEGVRRNEAALRRFDAETAQMFEDAINPDEEFHVQIGWVGLRTLCTTAEAQDRARAACVRQRILHRDWTKAYRQRMVAVGLA